MFNAACITPETQGLVHGKRTILSFTHLHFIPDLCGKLPVWKFSGTTLTFIKNKRINKFQILFKANLHILHIDQAPFRFIKIMTKYIFV